MYSSSGGDLGLGPAGARGAPRRPYRIGNLYLRGGGRRRPAVKAIVISVVEGGMGFVLWMGQVCTLQSDGDWNMAVSLAPDVHQ